jgi:hypothetical protein
MFFVFVFVERDFPRSEREHRGEARKSNGGD